MDDPMYVLWNGEEGIDSMSPRASQVLEDPEIEELRQAVRVLLDGRMQSELLVGSYRCRFVPLEPPRECEETIRDFLIVLCPDAEDRDAASRLTPTQRIVAEHAVTGATVEEISEKMDRSPHTIKTHLRNIYDRLGISSRVELLIHLGEEVL